MNETPEPSPRESWGAPRSKTITWYDPRAHTSGALRMSGRELLQAMIDGRVPPPPIASLFDAWIVSIGDGESLFRCRPDESTFNPIALVHGGLLCTLLDSAIGCAVQSLLPAGVGAASIEMKVSFTKPVPADGSEIEARGRVLRLGRRIAFAESHAYDRRGALLGHATSSLALVGVDLSRAGSGAEGSGSGAEGSEGGAGGAPGGAGGAPGGAGGAPGGAGGAGASAGDQA